MCPGSRKPRHTLRIRRPGVRSLHDAVLHRPLRPRPVSWICNIYDALIYDVTARRKFPEPVGVTHIGPFKQGLVASWRCGHKGNNVLLLVIPGIAYRLVLEVPFTI